MLYSSKITKLVAVLRPLMVGKAFLSLSSWKVWTKFGFIELKIPEIDLNYFGTEQELPNWF